MTTEKFTCADCGKEVEYEGGLAVWAKAHPDKVRCSECFDKYKSSQAGKVKKSATPKYDGKKTGSGSGETRTKKEISVELFKQVFDEFRAVFADELETVMPFLGAWTTTVILSRTK